MGLGLGVSGYVNGITSLDGGVVYTSMLVSCKGIVHVRKCPVLTIFLDIVGSYENTLHAKK